MKKLQSKKLIIVFLIFVFALLLRLWNLNQMGRTWDESAQFEDGYNFVKLISIGDFSNLYFYDHPFHPPLTKYLYGAAAYLDIESEKPGSKPFLAGEPTFKYDITFSRLVSVLLSSLTVIFVVLIGWSIMPIVGVVAGFILSSLPIFLGLSQIASIESILIFFFTGSVYSFFRFLKKPSFLWTVLTGIFLGLSMETKFTNVMLYPLLYIFYLFNRNMTNKANKFFDIKLLYIFLISVFVFFILWPMPWFHINYVLELNNKLRFAEAGRSVPEVFYGRLLLVPKVYYLVMFLITTPLLTILSFFLGSKIISDLSMNKNRLNFFKKIDFKLPQSGKIFKNTKPWFLISLVVWFCFPFLQSLYNFKQHGVRYIIQIYSPFSIIAAIGFVYLLSILKTKFQKTLLILVVLIYIFIPVISTSPYYLDYFNLLVGGPRNVYEKRMFQLGWWGEGIKEASLFLKNNAKQGSSVGLAVVPLESVAPMPGLKVEAYDSKKNYDYVMVSYFNVVREGFNDSKIKQKCEVVYSVIVDGAHLVDNYKCR